jgi:hypothetical protein
VVLPWYLVELNSVGIRPLALGARVWLPIVGAAVAWLCARGASKIVPGNFTACLISGIATVLIIGLLAYHMRPLLSSIRRASAEEQTAAPEDSAAAAVASAIDTAATVVSPATSGTEEEPEPNSRATPEETGRALALLMSLAVQQPEYPSVAGPIPIYHDMYDTVVDLPPVPPVQTANGSPHNELPPVQTANGSPCNGQAVTAPRRESADRS